MAKRPGGVVAFGTLQIVFNALGVFTMALLFIFLSFMYSQIAELYTAMGMNMTYTVGSFIYSFIISVLGLISGIWIFSMKENARKYLVYLSYAIIILGAVNLLILGFINIQFITWSAFGFIIGLVYYGLIIWYFKQPKIKKLFK